MKTLLRFITSLCLAFILAVLPANNSFAAGESSTGHNFSISNSIFTCRNLFPGNAVQPISQLKSSTITNFMSSAVFTYQPAYLKAPFGIEYNSTAAISLYNSGTIP